ncbi:MAG: tRNA lysidine(34) synthetase TilS [Candidatus Latescibacteria bacterium]|nr:tRNA lysidine(34) synthetase TilS [Candidatus Latescibacterota bacterium]
MIPREGTLLVAVSGGPDSIALLDFLAQFRERTGHPNGGIAVGHVNHGLRGEESDADAAFVEAVAGRMGLRHLSVRVEPRRGAGGESAGAGGTRAPGARARGESPEQAARTARYGALREMAERIGADRMAVAHTADDQAETVLLRLFRGSGLTGLKGMAPDRRVHGIRVVRPLLTTPREQVLEYLKRRGLEYRVDSTNLSADARRNLIRLEILPRIKNAVNPAIRETLLREAALFAEADGYLAEAAEKALPAIIRTRDPGKIALDAGGMLRYPQFLRKYLFRRALQELNGEILDLSTAHIEALLSLLTSHTGRSAHIAMGIRARRERETVVLELPDFESRPTAPPSKG